MARRLSVNVNEFASSLATTYTQTFGAERPEYAPALARAGRQVLDYIARSDMRYHNVEHTMLVTDVGQQILLGKRAGGGDVSPSDWLHFVLAVLCHDIGYVRGVCRADNGNRVATGDGSTTIVLPDGSHDATLTPYHVSRSELFVREQFGSLVADCDTGRVASYIEMTRFPPPDTPEYRPTGTLAGLVRAADFLGQFGDPNYLNKLPALFFEFEQVGSNVAMGYKTPGDMRKGFVGFFRKLIEPYIIDAMTHLSATVDGQEWIDTLNAHVREVELDNL